jgi:hypothetical protein
MMNMIMYLGRKNGICASPSRSSRRPSYKDVSRLRNSCSPIINSSAISATNTLCSKGSVRDSVVVMTPRTEEGRSPILCGGWSFCQSFGDVQNCDCLPYPRVNGDEMLLDDVPVFGVLTIVSTHCCEVVLGKGKERNNTRPLLLVIGIPLDLLSSGYTGSIPGGSSL